jgi:ZIP family zinc transporter
MLEAVGWGAVAASSLVLGALLAFARRWPKRQLGLVLAFGAGALISAVSFELAGEGLEVGSLRSTALGLGAGALTYFALDGLIAARTSAGRGRGGRAQGSDPGSALALGAFLDGIPEQLVLGIGVAATGEVGLGLLVAIFVSNLPEAVGSASEMERSGVPRAKVLRLWIAVAAICVLASAAGYGMADSTSGELRAAIDGFAAGALLVMLIDSMIPEATRDSGRVAGLVTTLGFAVATALSSLS